MLVPPGRVAPLIKRNTPFPIEVKRLGKTSKDNQRVMVMPLYEGEHATAKNNSLLGELHLSDLEARKEGEDIVQITLRVNRKGDITASAVDKTTKAEASIKIDRKKNITDGMIDILGQEVANIPKASELECPPKKRKYDSATPLLNQIYMRFDESLPTVFTINKLMEDIQAELDIFEQV